jgi:peptidoglycan/xylan/chitin deacetylase (PgdA/CDA1 family)
MRAIELGKKAGHGTKEFFARMRRKYYGPITHVQTDANLVALTFDDGPHPNFTVELTRILARFDAKATFFMVGKAASLNRDVVKLVAEEGHAIGNHSFTHIALPHLDSAARREEIRQCAETLRPYATMLFRPPYGVENMFCHRDARSLGYQVVKWNVAVSDWEDNSGDWIAEGILQRLTAGSIVLLHDNLIKHHDLAGQPTDNRDQTLDAVEKVLSRASGRFKFCTVPELLKAGRPMTSFKRR